MQTSATRYGSVCTGAWRAGRFRGNARRLFRLVPAAALRTGARLFLDAYAAPEVERIILLDAPAVLGCEAWRELAGRYGLGLVQFGLQSAIGAGAIVPQPVAPLAHVLIGALNESALYVARAEDPVAAREQCVAIIDRILHGLMTGA
ncbi:MAG: hypothetical protein ACRDPF_17910 [Streptosporangiaceae bacterium]